MSEKRYQISPIELVQWAEPLFGFGEGKARGFSEKTISSYEAAAGIRLPAALREYYLACGKASLNCALYEIFVPDIKAKLFEKRLTFSYDHIDEDLETFSKPGEEDYEELAKLRALPRERWGEVTGNYLLFWCENQGCWYAGIKAEDLPKLSAEFERIEEDKNRNIEGTGLGMSITIQLLALLGSRLHVESTYGKGSKFYFELEQKIIDDTPIGDFASNVQQMAQDFHYEAALYAPDAKLLVVDDNVVNRKVLRNLLKETAIQVTEAASGAECLQLVQENQFDLIFLDHMMPEMDGVETLHCMKALPEYPCKDTPVVVLTANAVSGAKEAYLSEGFDDFLSKPIVPDKLEAMLLKMLPEALLCTVREPVKKPEVQEAAALPLEELPFVEGLDWNYAWLHLPEYELLAYTVREFYDQIDSAADCLERAYRQCTEEKNPEPYRIQVHAMKSLAATIGIISLSGIARVLESAAKDGRIEVILSMTAIFLEEWRSYRLKLQGVFGIGSTQGKEVTDYSVIRALVEMVRVSMQEMEIDKADECVRQLRDYDFPAEIRQEIQKLAEAVTNLDPEETERLANLLSEKMAG